MSCFSCFVSRRKDVRRVEIDNGSRSATATATSSSGLFRASHFFLLVFNFLKRLLTMRFVLLQRVKGRGNPQRGRGRRVWVVAVTKEVRQRQVSVFANWQRQRGVSRKWTYSGKVVLEGFTRVVLQRERSISIYLFRSFSLSLSLCFLKMWFGFFWFVVVVVGDHHSMLPWNNWVMMVGKVFRSLWRRFLCWACCTILILSS